MGISNLLSHPSWGWTAFPLCEGMLQERGWLPVGKGCCWVPTGPMLPTGNTPAPSPCTHMGLLLKTEGAEKILLCSACFRDAVGFSLRLSCPELAACAWGFFLVLGKPSDASMEIVAK